MRRDIIKAMGIDDAGRLWVKPQSERFAMIYREAMEVHWDAPGGFLYSPKPREWSYLRWFQQIVAAAAEGGCRLCIAPDTQWDNIPSSLQREISDWSADACA